MILASRAAPLVCLLALVAFCGCGKSESARTEVGESSVSQPTQQAPSTLRGDLIDRAVELEQDTVVGMTPSGESARYRLINFEDEYSPDAPPTRTVLSPGQVGETRISLSEAKRMALNNNKNIEVLGFDPSAVETQIDTEEAVFDPVFRVNAIWQRIDEQTRDSVTALDTTTNVLNEDRFGLLDDIVSLSKIFESGLEARIAYVTDYFNQVPPGNLTQVNPAWDSRIEFTFEQPFFKDAGAAFNLAPIYIAQANFEGSLQDFQAAVNVILLNVESTYWNLFVTQQNFVAAEKSTKDAKALYDKQVELLKLGTGTRPDVDQALLQYQTFRIARVQAFNSVLAAERDFRRAVGMEAYQEERIIPSTKPSGEKYVPNWQQAIHESHMRPELESQRMAIEAAHLQLDRAYNQLRPDVRGVARYSVNGLDNNWDESISTIFDNQYSNWELGFRYVHPFWKRAENAQARQAEFILGREQATYRDLADVVLNELHGAYQNLITAYEVLELRRTQRRLAEGQLKARAELFGADMTDRVRFKDDLEAQQDYFNALQLENGAIAQYRIAIAQWHFAKGTIMEEDGTIHMQPGLEPEEVPIPPPAPEAPPEAPPEDGSQHHGHPSPKLALPSLEVPLVEQPQARPARNTPRVDVARRNVAPAHTSRVLPPVAVRPRPAEQTPFAAQPPESRQPERNLQPQPTPVVRPQVRAITKQPSTVAPLKETRPTSGVATKVRENSSAPNPAVTERTTPAFDLRKALLPLHETAKAPQEPKTASTAEKTILAPVKRKSSGPPIKVEYSQGRTLANVGEPKTQQPLPTATPRKNSLRQPSTTNNDVRFLNRQPTKRAPIDSLATALTPKSFTPRPTVDRVAAKRKTMEFVNATHKQLTPKTQPKGIPTIRFATPINAKAKSVKKQEVITPRQAKREPTRQQTRFEPVKARRTITRPRGTSPSDWLPKLGFEVKPSSTPLKAQPISTDIEPVIRDTSPLASVGTSTVMFR